MTLYYLFTDFVQNQELHIVYVLLLWNINSGKESRLCIKYKRRDDVYISTLEINLWTVINVHNKNRLFWIKLLL